MPTGDALTLPAPRTTAGGTPDVPMDAPIDAPIDGELQARIEAEGLSAVLADVTRPGYERAVTHLADPLAANSRAAYAAWLRRQVSAWADLGLPAVPVAAVDWPLASVRPQCLDVVGLLLTDLRELSPRMRPTTVPAQATRGGLPQPGVVVACVDLCVRLAVPASQLLAPALALTAGTTQVSSATRYLSRCADLADRAPGLTREVDGWARAAGAVQAQLAVLTARRLTDRLASGLEARVRTGW